MADGAENNWVEREREREEGKIKKKKKKKEYLNGVLKKNRNFDESGIVK